MFQDFDLWKLLAGLGIFLFGIFLMEESVKKLSGRTFRRFIREQTSGRIKSIFSGMMVTSILQSSSAVSLMILTFVGAGIMTMENAIGVILGSNLGTTITAWIIATLGFQLNIESFALPFIGIGGLGIIFLGQSERYSNISKLMVGFGFLFMGLDYMKLSVEVFANGIDLQAIPDFGIITYFGVGFALAAIMQSSSAAIALVLTALHADIINIDAATALVIGSNLGTTITILLGAIRGIQIKKRVALSHFVFNFITGIVALLLLPVLIWLVFDILEMSANPVLGIALFHTIFNLLGILIFLPFIKPFAKYLSKIFPDQKAAVTLFLNNITPDLPEAALIALWKETRHLIETVLRHNLKMLNVDEKLIFSDYDYGVYKPPPAKLSPLKLYENIKLLQSEIFTFATKVQSNELRETESQEINKILHATRLALHSAKTLKDVAHDFIEFENADNVFLNEQYMHFRKRLMETYLKIEKLLSEDKKTDKTVGILKILKKIRQEDKKFVALTTQAVGNKYIEDIAVSTALIANRAFVQSSRQILLSIKELFLTADQISTFEKIEDIDEILFENE